MKEFIIDSHNQNQRLDKYLLKLLNNSGKGFIYKMLRKKNIKLNSLKATGNEILKCGDRITLYLSDETINQFTQEISVNLSAGPLLTVFEDQNILVVNKPKSVLSQPESSSDRDTLIHRIHNYLHHSHGFDFSKTSTFSPSVLNRLDRNTTGLIISCKNLPAAQVLNEMQKAHQIEKYYFAVVKGQVTQNRTLTGYIKKTEGNKAEVSTEFSHDATKVVTEIFPIKSTNKHSLIKIKILSGKTHQIRVHLKSIGHPILGDLKYGDPNENHMLKHSLNVNSQLLHSGLLVFKRIKEPLEYLSGKEISCALPTEFQQVLEYCILD